MKVGIPKEIKNNENRVGMTPAGVAEKPLSLSVGNYLKTINRLKFWLIHAFLSSR